MLCRPICAARRFSTWVAMPASTPSKSSDGAPTVSWRWTPTSAAGTGALRARVSGVAVEFVNLDVYHLQDLGESFDIVLFLGVLHHLRYPLLALDLLREHVVRDMLIVQSVQRGSSDLPQLQENYPLNRTSRLRSARLSQDAFRRASLRRRLYPVVDPQSRVPRRHAAQRGLSHRGAPGGRCVPLPRRAVPGRRRTTEHRQHPTFSGSTLSIGRFRGRLIWPWPPPHGNFGEVTLERIGAMRGGVFGENALSCSRPQCRHLLVGILVT